MQTTQTTGFTLSDLASVDDLTAQFPGVLKASTLRWQLRSRKTNGLDKCCVTVGKRIMISRSLYEKWIGGSL